MSSKRDVHGSVRYQNDGRVVIVTGACSGIGWAIAAAFRKSGAEVLAVDVNESQVHELPDGVRFHQADVGREEECEAAVQTAVEEWGGVDVLVNNAGITILEYKREVSVFRGL